VLRGDGADVTTIVRSARAKQIALLPVLSRKWWMGERAAGPLDRFRIVAGFGLLVHFGKHFVESAPLLAHAGLYDPALMGENWAAGAGWLISGLSEFGLKTVFACGMLLAASVTVGFAPRVCAAILYLLSVASYRAILPIATLDDYLANVTALFLCLAPIGRTFVLLKPTRALFARPKAGQIGTTAEKHNPASSRVSGLVTTVFLLHALALYLTGGFGALRDSRPESAGWMHFATLAIPVAFVLPIPGLVLLGLVLQLVLHVDGLIGTPWVFSHIVLAATGILFWGERDEATPRAGVLDASAVVALVAAVLWVWGMGAALFGRAGQSGAAERILADTGLMPVVNVAPPAERSLAIQTSGEPPLTIPVYAGRVMGSRAGLLAARLEDSEAGPVRLSLASALAKRYCSEKGYLGHTARIVTTGAPGVHTLMEFECGAGGTLSRFR
jgi:hypothetical protein